MGVEKLKGQLISAFCGNNKEVEMPEIFSRRYGFWPTPEGLLHGDVPQRARIGLCNMISNFFGEVMTHTGPYLNLYQEICTALRIRRDIAMVFSFQCYPAIEKIVMDCEFWQFYDICEVIRSYPETNGERVKLAQQMNALFTEERLGFEFREDKIEKVGSGFIDAQIKEARYLLKEPEFKGADEHFEKAIKAINIRPNPDVENCIKDAVAAIESVGRVIVNDENALLSEIIKNMARTNVIPKPLDEAIQKVYAYRGNEPGVAHGATTSSKVPVYEAEFVLAMSAAIIIYLVEKYRSQ